MAQPAIASAPEQSQSARPSRPIDLVHLAKQCLGDENLEFEVLRMFDTTLSTYFSRLTLASDFDNLLINIHSIRGAAAGVGAWTVSDLAGAMEIELRDGRPIRSERIDDLGIAVEEVRGFIGRMLASQDA